MVLYSDSGLPSDVTIIGENTTEKRKVREELEKSNAKLTDLFDNANDLIQIFKPNGSIIFTNKFKLRHIALKIVAISNCTNIKIASFCSYSRYYSAAP